MAFPPDRGTADVGKGRDSSVKTISVEWAEGRGGRHRHFVRLSAPFNEEGGEGEGSGEEEGEEAICSVVSSVTEWKCSSGPERRVPPS